MRSRRLRQRQQRSRFKPASVGAFAGRDGQSFEPEVQCGWTLRCAKSSGGRPVLWKIVRTIEGVSGGKFSLCSHKAKGHLLGVAFCLNLMPYFCRATRGDDSPGVFADSPPDESGRSAYRTLLSAWHC